MKTVHNFVKSERELFSSSVRSFLPQTAIVPFSKKEYRCVVERNAVVSEGQVIALSEGDGQNAEALHAPVPGKVTDITQFSVSNGKTKSAVCISMAGSFSYLGRHQEKTNWKTFSEDYLLSAFSQKGVVNTFYIPKPLCSEIKSCTLSNNRFLVVRMFDEDPSRMTDTFVATRFTRTVVEGAGIICKAASAKGIVFALPLKAQFSIDEHARELLSDIPYATVTCDTSRYPAGFPQNIIQQIKKSLVKTDGVDFTKVNHKCLFIDPETAVSAYEAIVLSIPVVERFVHVTGDLLPSAALFKVRIGTTIDSLAKQCGGIQGKKPCVIINGRISGYSVSNMNIPVGKDVKSVEFVSSSSVANEQHVAPCINCGKCRSICPEKIYPDIMYRHSIGGKIDDLAILKTAELCSDCSLCNAVCPSRLPLSQTISLLRSQIQ